MANRPRALPLQKALQKASQKAPEKAPQKTPNSISDDSSAPLVLFGGTFDPVHLAHIACAKAVAAQFNCRVQLLPNAEPPHRAQPLSSSAQRLAMLARACHDEPALAINDWELRQSGPSYTADTLRHFRQSIAAERPLILLIGADSFASLQHWHQWQQFSALCHLVVAPRPGAAQPSEEVLGAFAEADANTLLTQPAGLRLMLSEPTLGISSSDIRADLREKGASSALNHNVFDYIRREGLYNLPHLSRVGSVGTPPANRDEDS